MAESWVINASPTILLAKAGLIELIPRLIANLVIPRPAAAELSSLAQSGIGSGERAVISWAAATPGFVTVLDDLQARRVARNLGVPLIGTVGVVLRLKQARLISETKPHLKNIRAADGYIGEELFIAALQQVGESP